MVEFDKITKHFPYMAVTGFDTPPNTVPFNSTSRTCDSARKKKIVAVKSKQLQLAAKAK